MKEILDTISLCEMIASDGLRNGNWKETADFVKEHFNKAQFENELIKKQFERLAYKIIDLRNSYEYLK